MHIDVLVFGVGNIIEKKGTQSCCRRGESIQAVGNTLKNAGPVVPAYPHLTHQNVKKQVTANKTDILMDASGHCTRVQSTDSRGEPLITLENADITASYGHFALRTAQSKEGRCTRHRPGYRLPFYLDKKTL